MMRWCVFVGILVLGYADCCTTPLGARSQCLSLYDCPQLLSAFASPPIAPDVAKFLRQSLCRYDGPTPIVCCGPLPDNNSHMNNGGDVDPVASEDSHPAQICGTDNGSDKLFGAVNTEIDEYPWMALLGYRTSSGSISFQCGGVLINQRYILTAAHCVKGAVEREVGQLKVVRLGEYDLRNATDCVESICSDPIQDIPVMGAYPHAGYSDDNINKQDDIAIIRLTKRAKLNYSVKPICLVDSNARIAAGNQVFVAGWGKTLSGRNSPVKQKLLMPVFDKAQCDEKYRRFGAELTSKQICAGGNFAEDACRGDSGGPVMNQDARGNWQTIGVVSFGYGCGRQDWPGVYTAVGSYIDWINDILQSTNV